MGVNQFMNIIEQIYENFGNITNPKEQVAQLEIFLRNHPIKACEYCSDWEIIKQKLFLRKCILEEDFFVVYRKLQSLLHSIYSLSSNFPIHELICYGNGIMEIMNSILHYYLDDKISYWLANGSENMNESTFKFFLMDTSTIPFDSLLGYSSYQNVILRTIFQKEDFFLLNDYIAKKHLTVETRKKKNVYNYGKIVP